MTTNSPNRSHSAILCRLARTLLALVIVLPATAALAQVELDSLHIFADTNVRVPDSTGPREIIANDRSRIILQADGTGGAQGDVRILQLDGAEVDAFDRLFARRSIDTTRIIEGVRVNPGDVFYFSGSGEVIIDFDAEAAGIPDGINLDAVTLDVTTGELKVSFDRFFIEPVLGFVLPGDLTTVSGGQLAEIAINGTLFPDGVNLVAAHQLTEDLYLISVDVDTQLPGGSGTFIVRDHDVILLDNASGSFESVLDLAAISHPSWEAAGINALWAELAPQSGEIRIVDAFREVQEFAGTIFLRVERVGGSEGPVGIFLDAVSGTATEGSDFSGDIAYTALWADGETGVRTIEAVDILDDGLEESAERFTVQLSISSGDATVGSSDQSTIRILDNDGDNLFSDGFES